jgi:hypothetical protein
MASGAGISERTRRLLADSLTPDESPIAEVLNVVHCQHEFFADNIRGIMRGVVKYA